jgi:hypothetical protein
MTRCLGPIKTGPGQQSCLSTASTRCHQNTNAFFQNDNDIMSL